MSSHRVNALVAALLGCCCLIPATTSQAQPLLFDNLPPSFRVHQDGDQTVVFGDGGGANPALCREGFDTIDHLYTEDGWLRFNRSGATGDADPVLWDYGNQPNNRLLNFGSHGGLPHTRVLSAGWTLSGAYDTTSSWLLTPEMDFEPGMTLSFWTRAPIDDLFQLPERLYVRACTSGDCADVGTGPDQVGNFTQQLAVINEALAYNDNCHEPDATLCTGYPLNWVKAEVVLPESGRGRIAFQNHYPVRWAGGFVPDGNGVVVGIDTIEIAGASTCPLRPNRLYSDGFEPPANRLIQNLDPAQVTASGAVCWIWGGGENNIRRNTWFRRFRLAEDHGLSGRVAVTGIDLGIGWSRANQHVPLRLHAIPVGSVLSVDNLSPIGMQNVSVNANDAEVIRHVETDAFITNASSHDLVVEISSEYGPAGVEFYMGLNTAGHTRDAYYSGACSYRVDSDPANPLVRSNDTIVPLHWLHYSGGPLHQPEDAPLIIAHFDERPF